MTTLIADLEADGLLDTITVIHQITLIDDDTGVLTSYNAHTGKPIMEGIQRLMAADRVVGHNWIGYDIMAVLKVYAITMDWSKVVDTMILSKLGNPTRQGGHSLEAWGERIDTIHKKVEHTDWTQWSPEMEYRCNEDTKLTQLLWRRLNPMLTVMPDAVHTEHATAWEVAKTIQRGFQLDVDKCHELVDKYMGIREQYHAKFKDMFPPILVSPKPSKPVKVLKVINKNHALCGVLEPGAEFCPVVVQEFNAGSHQQIANRLMTKYKWVPTVYTNTGIPETSEEVLRELEYPEAQEFADFLINEKKLSQINSEPNARGYGGGWLHHVRESGRVHANLNSLKAVTSRMSCSSPNLQQVAKVPEMRAAWIPGKGLVLLGADAEGLELRCLAHYLFTYDKGVYANMLVNGNKADGTDVHSVARDIIGFYDRDETKRGEYGWLYGAGDVKLGIIAAKDAHLAGKPIRYEHLGITVGKKQPANSTVGKAVRAKLVTGIVGLKDLSELVKGKAKRDGKFRGLDGRTLWVRSPHSALNLLLQSAGAIVVKKAWSLFHPDVRVVMQVHDEWQVEVEASEADDIGRHISECVVQAGVELGFNCPLASDYKIGMSWAETH
jgi:DNA polymerase-1